MEIEETTDVPPFRLRRRRRWIVGVGVFLALAIGGLWLLFHTLPWESSFRRMLDDAELVEIYRMRDGRPLRWVRLDAPEQWRDLGPAIRYQALFWQFGGPPTDAVIVQVIRNRRRYGAWDVREDGRLHLRKGARWYQMPVDGEFEKKVRDLLAVKGVDLPPNTPKAPTAAFPTLE